MKKIAYLALSILVFISPASAMEIQNIDIHGFISRGLLRSDHNNYVANTETGSLEFGETGINFGSELTDDLHIGLQFLSRDLGKLGNNEVKLDWAVADQRWKSWLGLRAGRLKMPLGLYNETRDLDMLRTSILLPQGVYPEMWRDSLQSIDGMGIYGDVPLGMLGNMSYQFQAGIMSMDADGGIAQSITDSLPIQINEVRLREAYNGKLAWQTPLDGFSLAASMLASPRFEMAGAVSGNPLTIAFNDVRLFFWSAEYIRGDLVLAGECNTIASESEILPGKKTFETLGYYFKASYRLAEWVETEACYSVFYADQDDKDGRFYASTRPWPNAAQLPPEYRMQPDFMAWNKDITLSLRFDINEFWLFKLESHFMNGAYGAPVGENLPDPANPGNAPKEDWLLLAAKVTYNF